MKLHNKMLTNLKPIIDVKLTKSIMLKYYLLNRFVLLNAVIVVNGHNEETSDYEDYETDNYKTIPTKKCNLEVTDEKPFQVPDEAWISNALKDVSYYLRSYKFNEWDRRYYQTKPSDNLIGFYRTFPKPPLRTIHWKVYDNCFEDFYKCLIYLHSVIDMAPFKRNDDIITLLNEVKLSGNDTRMMVLDTECKESINNAENTGLPFEGPLEKFKWRTSAAYYMCWYTMLEYPVLSLIGEKCDNFANCLDDTYGWKNQDPRANDRQSFSCAMYSFCPDPCCPFKHVKDITQCYDDLSNPCFRENNNGSLLEKMCRLNRSVNQNFEDMLSNRWNVTCNCRSKDFIYRSQFGICVDLNECTTGYHNCDKETESCFNLPGNYTCVSKH